MSDEDDLGFDSYGDEGAGMEYEPSYQVDEGDLNLKVSTSF